MIIPYTIGKKSFLVESWNIWLNFSNFSVGGCWGHPMLLFWKLVDETQKLKPNEATRHHNSLKLSILVPVKANFLYILQYETPCTVLKMNGLKKNLIKWNSSLHNFKEYQIEKNTYLSILSNTLCISVNLVCNPGTCLNKQTLASLWLRTISCSNSSNFPNKVSTSAFIFLS